MEHGARLSTTRVIGLGFICLGTVTVLSLATNVIQGINNYRLQNEQKVAVTPMLYNAPFAVSQNQSDASYLEQMGLSFVSLRLFVRAYPVENRVEIRGELKTWIGDSRPYSEIKHYVIQFNRLDGISWLTRFGEVTDENR